MASTIILSDNGASSGSAGLKQTAGNDGVLILQTTTSGGTATNAIYVDTSQNVGLGTASPSLKLTIAGAMNLTNSSRAGAFEITSGGDLWTGTATTAGNIIFETGHTTSGLPSTGTERVKINQYGIGLGATTPSSGMGITFPATQSASSDANTLDDYEEGTWTPAFSPTGTSFTSISYSVQSAFYTKIGNVVTVWFGVVINTVTVGSASGNLYVTGLPFNVYSSAAAYSQGNADAGTFLNNQPSVLIALQNSSYIGTFYRSSSNGALINQPATNAQNGAYVYGSLTYRTST